LADFDFDAAPGVDKKLIDELATCRYLDTATNVLLIGPPGVGKTLFAVGRGRAAAGSRLLHPLHHRRRPAARAPPSKYAGPPPCASSPAPALLVIDELGYLPLPARPPPPCSRSSPSATSKPHRADHQPWRRVRGEILGDTTVAAAMLDRLLHHCVVLNLTVTPTDSSTTTPANDTLRQTTTGTRPAATVTTHSGWEFR
jgi:hypothetical protein